MYIPGMIAAGREKSEVAFFNENDAFRNCLKKLAYNKGPIITSSSTERDIISIEEIFNQAEKTVFIVTDHLDSKVYNSEMVIEAADNFLKKEGSHLKIAMQLNKGLATKEGLISFLLERHKEKAVLGFAPETREFECSFMITRTKINGYAVKIKYQGGLYIDFNYNKINGDMLFELMTRLKPRPIV